MTRLIPKKVLSKKSSWTNFHKIGIEMSLVILIVTSTDGDATLLLVFQLSFSLRSFALRTFKLYPHWSSVAVYPCPLRSSTSCSAVNSCFDCIHDNIYFRYFAFQILLTHVIVNQTYHEIIALRYNVIDNRSDGGIFQTDRKEARFVLVFSRFEQPRRVFSMYE